MNAALAKTTNDWTLARLIRSLASQHPDAPCLVFDGVVLSYAELDERSSRLLNALRSRGVSAGDRVAILARNSPIFYELLFACGKLGAIMLPLNWRLTRGEIGAVLSDAEPALAVVDQEFKDQLRGDIPSIESGMAYASWRDTADAADPKSEVGTNDTALLLYTSGTTGQPKGVMLSHNNLAMTSRMAREIWGFRADSVNLVAMPLFHIGGMGYGLMALTQGGTTVLLRQPVATEVLDAVVKQRVTHAFFVPAVIQRLLDEPGVLDLDISSLELIVYGGSPINERLLRRAIDVLNCGFTHAYGLTETAGTVISLPPRDHDPDGPNADRLRSCGRPVPWVEAGIFEPESAKQVGVNEVGEIWVRSPANMQGYWRKSDESAETLRPDGWLRTGDAAYRDADGYFYIHDRYKDMIVSGGENIYPAEIENVLYQHPGVAEAAVIGVADERWGETPKALVVPSRGAVVPVEELFALVRKELAGYKCPRSIELVDSLPRNASGKVLKQKLRALYDAPTR